MSFGCHHRRPRTGGLNHRHVFSYGSGGRGPQGGCRKAMLPAKALGCGGSFLPLPGSAHGHVPPPLPLSSHGLRCVCVSSIVCLGSTVSPDAGHSPNPGCSHLEILYIIYICEDPIYRFWELGCGHRSDQGQIRLSPEGETQEGGQLVWLSPSALLQRHPAQSRCCRVSEGTHE